MDVWWLLGALAAVAVLWAVSAWIGLAADRRVVDTAWAHLVPHLDRRRQLAAQAVVVHPVSAAATLGAVLESGAERVAAERLVSTAVEDLLAEIGHDAEPDLAAAQFRVRVAGRIYDDCVLAHNARLRSGSARLLARPAGLVPRPFLLGDPDDLRAAIGP